MCFLSKIYDPICMPHINMHTGRKDTFVQHVIFTVDELLMKALVPGSLIGICWYLS